MDKLMFKNEVASDATKYYYSIAVNEIKELEIIDLLRTYDNLENPIDDYLSINADKL